MTERKQAAAALERAHEELERRVEERTEELQRSNERLRKEEAKLREILENSPMGVAIATRSSDGVHIAGERLFVNSALVRMFGGNDRERFIETPIDDSWVDLGQLAAVEEKFRNGEDLVDFEVQRRRMDGATWWVSMNTRQIHFDGQDCTMIWHFDITERKRTEAALRESEEQVRLLLDSTAEAIYGIDLEGNCSFANLACAEMLGYDSAEGLLGKHMHGLIHHTRHDGTPYPAEECLIYQAFTRGEGTHVEDEVLWRRDGTSFPAEYWSYPVRRDGEIVGAVVTFLNITNRKQAEEALRESEARYREIFDESPVGIWQSDWSTVKRSIDDLAERGVTEWRSYFTEDPKRLAEAYDLIELVDVSRAVLELYGVADTASLRKAYRADTVPEDNLNGFRDALLSFIDGDMTSRYDARERRADGAEIVTRNTLTVPKNYYHDWSRVIYSVEDITNRKRAEIALRESEERLRDAIESISEGFILYDADERFILCNSRYRDFYPSITDMLEPGAKLEDVARTAFEAGAVQGSAENVEAWLNMRLKQHRTAEGSHEQQLEDGRWLLCSETHTPAGNTVGIRTDITERKRAEEVLRISEMRLSGILDIAADAVISVDEAQTIVMFNQSAQNIFGYSAEEALGTPLDRLLPARFHAAHRTHIQRFGESPEKNRALMTGRDDVTGLRKDGAEFPAEASISKLDIGDRKIFTVTLRDISERRKAEAQLHQAQKMEAVGQLTGGIAHDFNNLLGIILGNAELLSDRVGEDDSQIRALLRATSRGADLTQRLLAFSRHQPLQPKAIDVGALVSGMVEMLRRSLGAAIEIEVASDRDLWTATADPGLLENALLNLVINARDAMSGEGRLVIASGNATLDGAYAAGRDGVTPGDYVLLAVTDNGSGMTPEVLARVFEPFYTTKEVGKGSGLGLSMVYGFAKQSGGHIALYSEEGKGTTVKLYLPRTGDAAVRAAPRVDETPRGKGETVLVVEDHADIRELAVVLLGRLGYQVLEAGDGAAALDIFDRGQPIDLLLTDMVLPGGMTGRDLATEAERRFGVLKVLFMSGYSAEAVHLNGWMDKGADLLHKPFRRHELATKVRAVLDRAPG